ncbi:MAG: CRTAC1 family protein [Polyangiales bacterium]
MTPRKPAVACLALLAACSSSSASTSPSDAGDAASAEVGTSAPTAWFKDVSASSGVAAVARDPSTFASFYSRMSGGVCVLDVDSDGHPDLFFPRPEALGGARLLHQRADVGPLQFDDVTAAWGLDHLGDVAGCVGADFDDDGKTDLVVTGEGVVELLHNSGSTFVDASTNLPPLDDPKTIVMAAVAFDADGDGHLDLAIAEYGHFTNPNPTTCIGDCSQAPENYGGGHVGLWLQGADGHFTDATSTLPTMKSAPAFVLLATDLDADGKVDLFVGNDLQQNDDEYLRNLGGGHFSEVATHLGVAHTNALSGVSSMSATDPDWDADGRVDLLESSWAADPDALYRCAGVPVICRDSIEAAGLLSPPNHLRWGQAMVDFDDDGVLDLLEAAGDFFKAGEPGNEGAGTTLQLAPMFSTQPAPGYAFTPVDPATLSFPATAGRGLIASDLDGDGDLDAVIASVDGASALLENTRSPRGHALTVKLVGTTGNRRAIGARVVVTSGSFVSAATAHAGHGFMSSDDGPLHFGLGAATSIDSIDVTWPDGTTSHVDATPLTTTNTSLTVTHP